jgi:hypothetical protein
VNQDSHKNNTVLIVIAVIGVVGTIIAAIITVIGNYNVEKLHQESALTQIALVSSGVQGGKTQEAMTNTTSTPIPTNIPAVSPETVTPAASPSTNRATSLYDDFNNIEFDNDFNHYIWEFWHDNLEGVTQENGSLKMQSTLFTSLIAREHRDILLNTPTFYETKIKLSDSPTGGSATIKLHVDLSNNNYWSTQCGLLVPDIAFCEAGTKSQSESTYVKQKRIDVKNWYTFRIEVFPDTKKMVYYIDGVTFGNANIPVTEDGLYSLVIGIVPVSGNTLAYFDDVSFGSIK